MIRKLLSGVTALTTGSTVTVNTTLASRSIQADVYGTGAVTATIIINGSDNGIDWEPITTFNLTGTTRAHSAYISTSPYQMLQANVTAITGTGATVDVNTID